MSHKLKQPEVKRKYFPSFLLLSSGSSSQGDDLNIAYNRINYITFYDSK